MKTPKSAEYCLGSKSVNKGKQYFSLSVRKAHETLSVSFVWSENQADCVTRSENSWVLRQEDWMSEMLAVHQMPSFILPHSS